MTTPLPILPQIIAEAGLVSASPVQPGTVLVLDDVTLGKLDTGTLGGDITWTDLSAGFTQRVISFTITRPSSRLEGPLWQYQAATASILLDNSDGALDPDNLAGPYVTAGATELVPMVPVRVRAIFSGTAYSLYSGHADGWMPAQVTYLGGYAELTLPATDGFKILAGLTHPPAAAAGAGETTGARIGRILNAAGWYTGSAWRTIATGKSTVQAYTAGDTPLNLMQVTSDSEIGQLYVDGTGRVVFRDRQQILTDARSASVQAVFGDLPGTSHTAGTELACAAVSRASDDTAIANDIQATRTGGTLQEVQDAASESKYKFPRTYQRSDLILQNDSDALNWAQWVLYVAKDAPDRFDTLAVDPQADPGNLWPQCLSREIGDRIQVWHRPANVAAFSRDCFITGITHQWDSVSSAWLTTWALQDASKYGSFLVLDDPVLGKLDSNAVSYLQSLRSSIGRQGLERRRCADGRRHECVDRAARRLPHHHPVRHLEHDAAERQRTVGGCRRQRRLHRGTRPDLRR